MLSLIVTIIFGLGITFFAFQNSILVPVNPLGTQTFNMPLYLVSVISLLAGILMAWIISMMDGLSHFIQIHGKDNVIQNDKKAINQLQEKVHNLEIENSKLLAENKKVSPEASSNVRSRLEEEPVTHKPSFMERFFPSSGRKFYAKHA